MEARPYGLLDSPRGGNRRYGHDLGIRDLLKDLLAHRQAAHPAHIHIEEHKVGLLAAGDLDRLLPDGGDTYDLHPPSLKDPSERVREQPVVLDDQDADSLGGLKYPEAGFLFQAAHAHERPLRGHY